MTAKYDVSIITVNYNSSDYTVDFVENIKNRVSQKVQIIIVDNNSSPVEFSKLSRIEAGPDVLIVRSRVNYGFSGGNMLGVQYANARYYFFLNNDTLLMNDCVEILTRFMDSNQSAGMCSPIFVNDAGLPQPSFDYFPSLLSKIFGTAALRLVKKDFHPRRKIPERNIKVDVLSGSHLFVRAELFDKIGGFDLSFFLYCEEEDLAKRISYAGYTAHLIPEARNFHFEGASSNAKQGLEQEFLLSFFYFYRKHYGKASEIAIRCIFFVKYLRRVISGKSQLGALRAIISSGQENSIRHQESIGPYL